MLLYVGLGFDSRAKRREPSFTISPSSCSGRIEQLGGMGKVGNQGIFVKIAQLLDPDAFFLLSGK